ncbi:TIGR04282 family arsenosugar biosynthesis glycosyltransferase [Aridibaculum aurantiacum]|uniref:TIGR04282 family arsenosugar biosynthesis glycosyltransferase n=1 Tax=Aridibaculum aurantiacum TaxID=2810307 RepID=UPI001A961008|nr:TIGR04282 family arsenosugar biosynthesis glycosyltransferase [Aridibaculum aurantiacum]
MESAITKALIIFVRNTEKGKVKTRIAKDLGDDKTLEVYKYLLQYTADIANTVNCHRFVFYSDYVHISDLFDDKCFTKFVQEGNDLGERMHNALEKVFSLGHKEVCIIGSDCYQLQPDHIDEAFAELESHDVVVGPTTDGGYYLLGMKQANLRLFQQKDWGTSTVFDDTVADLTQLQLKYKELEQLDDVDTMDDLLATDILANLSSD